MSHRPAHLPHRRHPTQRALAWLLLAALVLATLAPGIARALSLGGAGAGGWGQVCSVNGLGRSVALPAADGTASPTPLAPADDASHLLSHCPYCSLHADQLGLPPTAAPAVTLPPLRFQQPPLFLHAPRPQFAWAAAQPRAPPRFV